MFFKFRTNRPRGYGRRGTIAGSTARASGSALDDLKPARCLHGERQRGFAHTGGRKADFNDHDVTVRMFAMKSGAPRRCVWACVPHPDARSARFTLCDGNGQDCAGTVAGVETRAATALFSERVRPRIRIPNREEGWSWRGKMGWSWSRRCRKF